MEQLRGVEAFAILTSNAAAAAWEFVGRFDDLASRLAAVVGREELGGPKAEYARFAAGYASCARSTAEVRGGEPVIYAGDADYELEFARGLGAIALKVDPSTGELRNTAAPLRDVSGVLLVERLEKAAGDSLDFHCLQPRMDR